MINISVYDAVTDSSYPIIVRGPHPTRNIAYNSIFAGEYQFMSVNRWPRWAKWYVVLSDMEASPFQVRAALIAWTGENG